MANVQHSTLTGSSLHEPKGIAAAAANKVYVSDGSASGSWTTVPVAALASTANPFGAQLLHVRDEQTQNTVAASYTSGAYRTIVLNTIKTNEIAGATLTSNQLSLPVGTYFVVGIQRMNGSDSLVQPRIYNVTDSTVLILGSSTRCPTGLSGGMVQDNFLLGRFTLSGTKTVELQAKGNSSWSGGIAANLTTEVYSELLIWKIS